MTLSNILGQPALGPYTGDSGKINGQTQRWVFCACDRRTHRNVGAAAEGTEEVGDACSLFSHMLPAQKSWGRWNAEPKPDLLARYTLQISDYAIYLDFTSKISGFSLNKDWLYQRQDRSRKNICTFSLCFSSFFLWSLQLNKTGIIQFINLGYKYIWSYNLQLFLTNCYFY